MFYLRYIASELRRRRGRTIFTALGLGVGVGLVVAVSALSSGLDAAQSKVLQPLTGVGTDMSVTRPIVISGSGSSQSFAPGQGPQLSAKEQRELRRENGGGQFDLNELGKPGQHFNTTQFMTTNLSFPTREERRIDRLDGSRGELGRADAQHDPSLRDGAEEHVSDARIRRAARGRAGRGRERELPADRGLGRRHLKAATLA